MRAIRIAILAIATIIVVVLGIITAYTITDGDPQNNNKKIRVAYFPNIGHAIPIVGMETGTFAEHLGDVKITTQIFDSGPQVIESIFAGSTDVAYVGPGPAINGYLTSEKGAIRILSGAAVGGASFVAHPDSDLALKDKTFELGGKKIAAPQIGNTQDVSLRHYISERGLKPAEKGGNVTIYNIPNPDIYTLFVKSEIDGAWVAEPWATILEQELGGIRIFQEEETWPNNRFASVLLIADTDYTIKNSEIIESWLEAHKTTAAIINSDKELAAMEFNKFMANHFGRGLNPDVVRTSIHNIEITPDMVEESIHEFAQRADKLGYLGRGAEHDISGIFYEPREVMITNDESMGGTSGITQLEETADGGAQWQN